MGMFLNVIVPYSFWNCIYSGFTLKPNITKYNITSGVAYLLVEYVNTILNVLAF